MIASLKGSLFPSRQYMMKDYPYVKTSTLFLPIAWINRIIKRFVMLSQKPKGQQNEIQIGMERVELLRKYGVIK